MKDFLTGKKHVHFIGIGGSGMYPLAQILHSQGYYLTGSDNNETETLERVRKMGIPVYLGQCAENIGDADLIVHTAAIMSDNPELIAAKASGAEVVERSILLGLITSRFEKAICITGTHGKTTVSSMMTHILLAENIDLSAVIGGKLRAINGSGIAGKSEYMVCEACEFQDHFLNLFPNISIILNVDCDHMEYFKTLENLERSFSVFCNNTTDLLVYNADDENTVKSVSDSSFNKKKVTFGWSETSDYYPRNVKKISNFEYSFELYSKGRLLDTVKICVPGKHNILNAVASCATALEMGIPLDSIKKGLESFGGTGRRFERLAQINGITIADDYAHHPAEVKATLETAKSMDFKRIIAVHQPFTYSRTFTLMDDFAQALKIADKVVLTEIMGSREKNTYNVFAKDLAEKIDGCDWFSSFEEVADYTAGIAREGDLIITMGCGDVYKVAEMIIKRLK